MEIVAPWLARNLFVGIKHALVSFLVLSLLIPFPALVHAQSESEPPPAEQSVEPGEEASLGETESFEETPQAETTPPKEESLPPAETESEEVASPEEESEIPLEPEAAAASSGSTPTESGAVFIHNETTRSVIPEVDTQTGSLTYSYSLAVPPGRNGMTPALSLNYDSNSSGNTSVFGYGWSISIPHIKRINRFGSEQLYSSSTIFHSSLDGELVHEDGDEYRPLVENGAFRRYTFDGTTWTVLQKDGTQLLFGETAASRRDDPSNSSRTFSWHLEEERDLNDNYIKYEYYKETGQIYPSVITYTGHDTTDGIFTVSFTREARSDNLVSNETGFTSTTTSRVSRIEAAISGSWVGRYDLAYSAGHNSNRSLLTSITRSGRDEEATVTTLPATNFTYETYSSSDKEWNLEEGWEVPVNIVREEVGQDDGARFIDINGDSLVDIIQSAYTSFSPGGTPASQTVYLNTGEEWVTSEEWTIPSPYDGKFGFTGGDIGNLSNFDNGARFADVNNDGLTDILWSYSTEGFYPPNIFYDYEIREVYINNGVDGWATTTEWSMPQDILFAEDAYDAGGRVADLNGDSLPDLFLSTDNDLKVYLNTGAGWTEVSTSTWNIPELFTQEGGRRDMGTRLADVNGDGLADVLRSYESDWSSGLVDINKVYLNTGAGWVESSWSIPLLFAYRDSDAWDFSFSTRLVDVNGDALVDIVASSTQTGGLPESGGVYINTGEGWTHDTTWGYFPYLKFGYTYPGDLVYTEAGVANMDVDGDNLIDFVKAGPDDTYPTYDQEYGVYLHEGVVPDLLSSIEYPEGAEVSIEYEQSARYEDAGDRLNPDLPLNLNTVSSITYDDGVSDSYEHTYSYGGGHFYFASSTRNQFAGFSTTTKQDERGNITHSYIHQGNGSQSALGEFEDDFEKIGKTFLIEKFDDEENLFSREIYRWESEPAGTSSTFVFNTRQIAQQFDGDEDYKGTAAEYEYDSTGNLLNKIEWGEVLATSTSGFFEDTGEDKKVTEYEYASSTGAYLVNLPAQISVFDQDTNKVSESRFYYDDQVLRDAIEGNLTLREDWISGGTYIDTQWSHNTYGLVIEEVGPRSATTTYSYDTHNLYPASVTNALSQVSTSTYDYSLGKPKASSDANGYVSEWIYDGLDRVLEEKKPDPASGTSVTVRTNEYTDTRGAVELLTENYLSSENQVSIYQYFDGFGRSIQSRTETENEDEYVVRDWTYGDDGLLVAESLPYFDEDEDHTSATGNSELLVSYEHDALGRKILSQNILGSTLTSYDQWEETVTDPLLNEKTYSYDAYGRLTGVVENNEGAAYETSYEWDLNNKLTKITDALENVRNFTYDGLGRRLTAEDLHDTADATFGAWEYEYDDSSNLTEVTDAKGQVIQSSFDLLNRQLTEDYTSIAGVEVSYTYDSCTNGVGRLCTASSTGAISAFTYTPNGLIATESKTIDGSPYTTEHTYDRQGNALEITYPDDSAVRYTYNAGGQLETVEQQEDGDTFEYLVNDFDYGPHGLATYQENANCTYTQNIYNEDNLYRLYRTITDKFDDCEEMEMLMGGEFESGESFERSGLSALEENSDLLAEDIAAAVAAFSTTTIASTTVTDFLANKSAEDKATLKGQVMAQVGKIDRVQRDEYSIEIVSTTPIKKGVSVFARAWDANGEQIGFGEDGTVDMERFRIFNPPILVPDPNGEIVRILEADEISNTSESELRYREDPREALLQVIEQNLSVMKNIHGPKNIVPGKRGNTTSTFYPDAHPESTTVDGDTYNQASGWNTAHDQTTAGDGSSDTANNFFVRSVHTSVSNLYNIIRAYTYFDTSSIDSGDAISSATVSVYVYATVDGENDSSAFITTVQVQGDNVGSDTAIADTDTQYNGDAIDNPTEGVSTGNRADITGISTNAYLNFSLNSTGIGWIAKSGESKPGTAGITYLGFREGHDVLDDPLNGGTNTLSSIRARSADQSGSTEDPKLVVEHASSNTAPTAPSGLEVNGMVNPTNLTNPTPEFSAVFNDPNTTDTAFYYRIQVATTSDFSSTFWDSTKTSLGSSTPQGTRSEEIAYGGSALASSTSYYWRIKFWDSADAESDWSTTTSSFSLRALQQPILDSIYSYDVVGNITAIVDIRDRQNPLAEVYGYDDLYRLISVGTTTASIQLGDTIVIQPDSSVGKDTYWGTVWVTDGDPTRDTMWVGGWGDNYYSYVEFPLTSAPPAEDVEYAELHLYNTASNNSNSAKANRITQSWTESGVNSTNYPNVADIGMGWHSVPDEDWWIVDVTQLVKDWQDDTYENYGFQLVGNSNSGDVVKSFATSDNSDPTLRPKLVIKREDEVLQPPLTLGVAVATTSTYAYDAVGNIASTTGLGSFTYAETGKANPHAVTGIGGTTYTYDDNGNLTGYTGGNTLTWDYKNRLTASAINSVNASYQYDHLGQRVAKTSGGVTTRYPNNLYEHSSATTTKHVYAGNMLAASIYGTGSTTASTTYAHLDYLNSIRATTDEEGNTTQQLEYTPWGAEESNVTSASQEQTNRYIGENYDQESELSYLNARYYDGGRGQFLSQDPVFRAIGNPNEIKQLTQVDLGKVLMDPQALNSYSYARNNPIRYSDPEGLWFKEFATGQQSFSSFQVEVGQATQYMTDNNRAWGFAVDHPYTTGAVVGFASAGAAQAGLYGAVSLKAAAYPGVGMAYSASRVAEGTAYLYLAQNSLSNISSLLDQLSKYDPKNPSFSSSAKLIYSLGLDGASTFGGEKVGGVVDTYNLISSALKDISKSLNKLKDSINKNSNKDKKK